MIFDEYFSLVVALSNISLMDYSEKLCSGNVQDNVLFG